MSRWDAWLALAARGALAGVFLLAAVPKVAQPRAFALAVSRYDLLPGAVAVNVVAVALPFVELAVVALLLAGFRIRAAAGLALLLLLVFLGGQVSAIARGLDINCGCFDPSGTSPIGWWDLLRSFLLMVPAALCLALPPDRLSLDRRLASAGGR